MTKMVVEDIHYDRIFKDNGYITDLKSLLTRVGVNDFHTLAAYLDYMEEYLRLRFDPRYMNYFSVAYDSGYYLNISMKQVRP